MINEIIRSFTDQIVEKSFEIQRLNAKWIEQKEHTRQATQDTKELIAESEKLKKELSWFKKMEEDRRHSESVLRAQTTRLTDLPFGNPNNAEAPSFGPEFGRNFANWLDAHGTQMADAAVKSHGFAEAYEKFLQSLATPGNR